MRTQSTFLTQEGYRKLEQELNHLCTVRRKEIANLLRQVLPDSDILENGELEDAYNERAFLEGRIQTLKNILSNVVVIEETGPRDTVGMGSYVTIIDLTRDNVLQTYRIVGSAEADPAQGSISNESPLGKELMGRKVGEEVIVSAPDGEFIFRVVRIH
jgi:transcription elongation factor GreA